MATLIGLDNAILWIGGYRTEQNTFSNQ